MSARLWRVLSVGLGFTLLFGSVMWSGCWRSTPAAAGSAADRSEWSPVVAEPWPQGASERVLFCTWYAGKAAPARVFSYERGVVRCIGGLDEPIGCVALAGPDEVPVGLRAAEWGASDIVALFGMPPGAGAGARYTPTVVMKANTKPIIGDPSRPRVALIGYEARGRRAGREQLGILPLSREAAAPAWWEAQDLYAVTFDHAGELLASRFETDALSQVVRIDPATGGRDALCEVGGCAVTVSPLGPGRPRSVVLSWSAGNEPRLGVLDTDTKRLRVVYYGPLGGPLWPSPKGARLAWTVEPEAAQACRAFGGPRVKHTALKGGICVLDLRSGVACQVTLDPRDKVAGFAGEDIVLYLRHKGYRPFLRAVGTTGKGDREVWRWTGQVAEPVSGPATPVAQH